MFKKKQQAKAYTFDVQHQKPIIRCSICTGEKVAGFKNLESGKFTEVMLIKTEEDLRAFRENYQLGDAAISKEY